MDNKPVDYMNKFLSEGLINRGSIVRNPKILKISEDKTRAYIHTFLGFYCYRDGVCIGEARNLDDAIAWVDSNKEIEMWT